MKGGYALWGKEQQLVFEIDGPPPAGQQNRRALDTYMYDGGYDQYRANAGRLLATTIASAHVPLFAYVTPQLVKRLTQRYPHLLSLEDIARAPLACYELTAEDSTGREGVLFSELRLGARISFPGLVLESLMWSAALAGFLWGFFHSIPDFTEIISSDLLPFPWLYVLLGGMIIPLAISAAYQRRRNKRPVVIADNQGLICKTAAKDKPIFVPWGEIEAWAVKRLPKDGYEDRLYVVCSVSQTLTWVEQSNAKLAGRGVQGDRQEAYRMRAARLHRLITARMRQPFREIFAPSHELR